MTETFQTPPALTPDYSVLSINGDKPWSPKGRFGRLSYLAWFLVASLTICVMFGVGFGIIAASGGLIAGQGHLGLMIGGIASVILYIALIYFSIIFGIRRLHDVNRTGWWMLLQLLPLVGGVLSALHIGTVFMLVSLAISVVFGLYLMLAKGTEGTNDYGMQRATPQWEKVCGWIYIILIPTAFILGICAAIAIPAYQDYVKRAHAAELSQSTVETTPAAQ